MLSPAKAVFSYLWNSYIFCHIYTDSTAFTREVLWDGCVFKKNNKKKERKSSLTYLRKLWQIHFKIKYWISY